GRPGRRVRVGAHPHAVTALTDGSVAVGNEASSTVSIIRHGRVRATVGVATQPGGLATLAGGRLLAVVSVRERVLETYDTRTFKRVSTTPAGVGPTHLACMGKTCWVVDTQGDSVLVFGDSGRSLTRRYDLPGGPYGIAIDPVHARLYVTLPALNQVVELPAQARPHVLRRWATPRQPDTVAVDPRRQKVYVTGTASNELQVISLASARPHS
ncbi:MAG: hypothetical protein J2O48_05510, partial [Solirubrobacterales bacterium]|nr:hypothetical protein [Solirubrobacterales bacterium]